MKARRRPPNRPLKDLLALLRAYRVTRYKKGTFELELSHDGRAVVADVVAPKEPQRPVKPPPLQVPPALVEMGVTAEQLRDGAALFGGD